MICLRHIIVTFMISMMVLFVNSPGANARKLTIVTGEWLPYTSATLENKGEFSQLVTIVLNDMGITPDYRFYPWR